MKILQLGKFYPIDIMGGIQMAIYNITEELNKRNIKCDILCSNVGNEYKEDIINNYKVFKAASYGIISSTSISPQMISKLKKIISEYDIIHIHHPDPMANLALFMANPKKQKIVVHWHSDIIKQRRELARPLHMDVKKGIIIGTSKIHEESEQLKSFLGKCMVASYLKSDIMWIMKRAKK